MYAAEHLDSQRNMRVIAFARCLTVPSESIVLLAPLKTAIILHILRQQTCASITMPVSSD